MVRFWRNLLKRTKSQRCREQVDKNELQSEQSLASPTPGQDSVNHQNLFLTESSSNVCASHSSSITTTTTSLPSNSVQGMTTIDSIHDSISQADSFNSGISPSFSKKLQRSYTNLRKLTSNAQQGPLPIKAKRTKHRILDLDSTSAHSQDEAHFLRTRYQEQVVLDANIHDDHASAANADSIHGFYSVQPSQIHVERNNCMLAETNERIPRVSPPCQPQSSLNQHGRSQSSPNQQSGSSRQKPTRSITHQRQNVAHTSDLKVRAGNPPTTSHQRTLKAASYHGHSNNSYFGHLSNIQRNQTPPIKQQVRFTEETFDEKVTLAEPGKMDTLWQKQIPLSALKPERADMLTAKNLEIRDQMQPVDEWEKPFVLNGSSWGADAWKQGTMKGPSRQHSRLSSMNLSPRSLSSSFKKWSPLSPSDLRSAMSSPVPIPAPQTASPKVLPATVTTSTASCADVHKDEKGKAFSTNLSPVFDRPSTALGSTSHDSPFHTEAASFDACQPSEKNKPTETKSFRPRYFSHTPASAEYYDSHLPQRGLPPHYGQASLAGLHPPIPPLQFGFRDRIGHFFPMETFWNLPFHDHSGHCRPTSHFVSQPGSLANSPRTLSPNSTSYNSHRVSRKREYARWSQPTPSFSTQYGSQALAEMDNVLSSGRAQNTFVPDQPTEATLSEHKSKLSTPSTQPTTPVSSDSSLGLSIASNYSETTPSSHQ